MEKRGRPTVDEIINQKETGKQAEKSPPWGQTGSDRRVNRTKSVPEGPPTQGNESKEKDKGQVLQWNKATGAIFSKKRETA